MEGIADGGDVDTYFSRSSRHAAGGMSWKLVYQCNEESVFDKKDEDVPQEMMSALPAFCLFILSYVVVFVHSLSHAWFFATPGTAAHQASLSFTISQSLLRFKSIESVMLVNHLILCGPLLFLHSTFPSIRVFANESGLHIALLSCVLCCALSLSCVWFFANPWTVARQAPLSMGFFRQEYWSGLPLSSLGKIFPTQVSHITGRFFTIWATREAQEYWSG